MLLHPFANSTPQASLRVLMLGASGTIGKATALELHRRGHEVLVLRRAPHPSGGSRVPVRAKASDLHGLPTREVDFTRASDIFERGIAGERFDAVLSCMASRTGAPQDAWAVDHAAHLQVLQAAQQAGVGHMVLLSAICVQKPVLAFQQAKLAFERALRESGMGYSIVRPTAFFKSLSGQVDRVRQGRTVLLFGDGQLTACKPISDRDLAVYLADCLADPHRRNRVLPIGGPGPAQTPLQQALALFEAAGLPPRFKRVPVRLMDAIVGGLGLVGTVWPAAAAKAELARIGRYYATESMLVWDAQAARYDEQATPSWGEDRLLDFQLDLLHGRVRLDRGEHAVF